MILGDPIFVKGQVVGFVAGCPSLFFERCAVRASVAQNSRAQIYAGVGLSFHPRAPKSGATFLFFVFFVFLFFLLRPQAKRNKRSEGRPTGGSEVGVQLQCGALAFATSCLWL